MTEKHIPSLSSVREAYIYSSEQYDGSLAIPYREAARQFDDFLDRHTATQIRKYLYDRMGELTERIAEINEEWEDED